MAKKHASPDEYKKAAILLAVRGRTMSRADAYEKYMLSSDEFSLWELAFDAEGIIGLRDRRLAARRRARKSPPSKAEWVTASTKTPLGSPLNLRNALQ